jgi:hypothetical protein
VASANDIEDAQDTLDNTERSHKERDTLRRLLAAYKLCDDYEEFCGWLGLKIEPATADLYSLAHYAYIESWNRYGWERLQMMCRKGWDSLYLNDRRLM